MAGYNDNIPTIKRGPIYSKGFDTDGVVFIGPFDAVLTSQNTNPWVFTRVAAQEPSARVTANGAGAFQVTIPLEQVFQKIGSDPIFSSPGMPFPAGTTNFPGNITNSAEILDSSGHLIRGFQIVKIDYAYSISTAALTSQTLVCKRNTFANNVAIAQTDPSGGFTASPALATATQANPYLTTLTPATQFVCGGNVADVADYLENSVVPLTTAVYDFWGCWIYYNYCIL